MVCTASYGSNFRLYPFRTRERGARQQLAVLDGVNDILSHPSPVLYFDSATVALISGLETMPETTTSVANLSVPSHGS
jgi:hypothetical protein